MSEKKISSLKKIGYLKKLPTNSDINDYESLLITAKDGKKITLYRLSSKRQETDEISNFSTSWNVFNSYLE